MSEAPDLLAALGRSVEKAREARQADSRIDRAARVLSTAPWDDLTVTEQVRWLNAATRLDAAGLLTTPERDAEVAARAWDEGRTAGVRNASAEFDGPVQDNPYKREGGAS